MGRANVSIERGEGNLGGVVASLDGVTLIIATVPAAYVPTAFKYFSLANAEAAGITEAEDISNSALLWEHIKDFYSEADNGTELHLLILDESVLLEEMFTDSDPSNDTILAFLQAQEGRIRNIVVVSNPSFVEVGGSISTDLAAAIPLAQVFALSEFALFRPMQILFEGRDFAGTIAAATDLSGLDATNVAIFSARDKNRAADLVTAGIALAAKYAAAGGLAGRIANIPVQRNSGRVKSGAVANIVNPELSGGQQITLISDSDLDVLDDKHYLFLTFFTGVDGFYYNNDYTAVAKSSDYFLISRNRTINKVARITYLVYVNELLDEVQIDPNTGELTLVEVRRFKNEIESEVRRQMVDNAEIISVNAFIDPSQNVLSTGIIEIEISVVPVGQVKEIKATVQFFNPFNQ